MRHLKRTVRDPTKQFKIADIRVFLPLFNFQLPNKVDIFTGKTQKNVVFLFQDIAKNDDILNFLEIRRFLTFFDLFNLIRLYFIQVVLSLTPNFG